MFLSGQSQVSAALRKCSPALASDLFIFLSRVWLFCLHACLWISFILVPAKARREHWIPGFRVTESCEPPSGCQESNPGPLEEPSYLRPQCSPSASSFVQFPPVLFSGNFPQFCDLAIVLNFQCGNPMFTHQISHALVLSVFKRLIFKWLKYVFIFSKDINLILILIPHFISSLICMFYPGVVFFFSFIQFLLSLPLVSLSISPLVCI